MGDVEMTPFPDWSRTSSIKRTTSFTHYPDSPPFTTILVVGMLSIRSSRSWSCFLDHDNARDRGCPRAGMPIVLENEILRAGARFAGAVVQLPLNDFVEIPGLFPFPSPDHSSSLPRAAFCGNRPRISTPVGSRRCREQGMRRNVRIF